MLLGSTNVTVLLVTAGVVSVGLVVSAGPRDTVSSTVVPSGTSVPPSIDWVSTWSLG